MKQQFKELKMRKSNIKTLLLINSILEDYVEEGYKLTLRQLYYQLVARDLIENKKAEYVKLSSLLKEGRLAGIVDWDAIEDRTRKYQLPYWTTGIEGAITDITNQYRLKRMEGQPYKIEIWVEKDALSNILFRVSSKYGIKLMVNRGYSSVTAMYDAAQRLNSGDCILYFGDHDPSGLDMIRDIEERMWTFNKNIEVVPVALTMEQIEYYAPPPNYAKISDPRSDWYISQYGSNSWELDALPPNVLTDLAEEAVTSRIDLELYEEIIEQEKRDKKEMKAKFNLTDEEE